MRDHPIKAISVEDRPTMNFFHIKIWARVIRQAQKDMEEDINYKKLENLKALQLLGDIKNSLIGKVQRLSAAKTHALSKLRRLHRNKLSAEFFLKSNDLELVCNFLPGLHADTIRRGLGITKNIPWNTETIRQELNNDHHD